MTTVQTVKSFKDLEIWQLATDLCVNVYKLLKNFPKEEIYGLTSQTKDAVVSVAANIAESYGRFHYKDKIKFLYNSRGSLLEVESHLLVGQKLQMVRDINLLNQIMQDITRLNVKINNYRTAILKSAT